MRFLYLARVTMNHSRDHSDFSAPQSQPLWARLTGQSMDVTTQYEIVHSIAFYAFHFKVSSPSPHGRGRLRCIDPIGTAATADCQYCHGRTAPCERSNPHTHAMNTHHHAHAHPHALHALMMGRELLIALLCVCPSVASVCARLQTI